MKLQLDSGDVRQAIAMMLTARGVPAGNIDINIHATAGVLTRCEVIIREPLAEGQKPPRKRRIPILGEAT